MKKIKVCVIGQGFVGLPMSIAVSNVSNKNNKPLFDVIGLEKNDFKGNKLKNEIENYNFPLITGDKKLKSKFIKSLRRKNFKISTDINDIKQCKIVIISINFEVKIIKILLDL